MSKDEKKKHFEEMIEEINEYSKRMKENRFHKRDNPVKTLIKEPKKEQKVEGQNEPIRKDDENKKQ